MYALIVVVCSQTLEPSIISVVQNRTAEPQGPLRVTQQLEDRPLGSAGPGIELPNCRTARPPRRRKQDDADLKASSHSIHLLREDFSQRMKTLRAHSRVITLQWF